MRVEELMTKQVQSCVSDDSLERAAQLMWDQDCGCLPVCASVGDGASRVAGMITDRDICMCALLQRRPLHELRVRDAMSKELLACRPDDTLERAEKIMRQGQIRRMPVLTEQGTLTGMISLADLAREAARESSRADKAITEMEIGDTLAQICAPRPQSPALNRLQTAPAVQSQQGIKMERCETCGNEYGHLMQVTRDGQTHHFDSFECAIHALAPKCTTCGVPILGHGMEHEQHLYCSASCARSDGNAGFVDHI
jgi:CBS domain-containing protein